MAKTNQIGMPSGQGGLTSFAGDGKSKIALKPVHVLILIGIVIVLEIILHLNGYSLLGIAAP